MIILRGWKEVANYCRCSIRTLERWNKERVKIPYLKNNPAKGGAISIPTDILDLYLIKVSNTKKRKRREVVR